MTTIDSDAEFSFRKTTMETYQRMNEHPKLYHARDWMELSQSITAIAMRVAYGRMGLLDRAKDCTLNALTCSARVDEGDVLRYSGEGDSLYWLDPFQAAEYEAVSLLTSDSCGCNWPASELLIGWQGFQDLLSA